MMNVTHVHAGSSFIILVSWEAIMRAMGFGQRVTGGEGATTPIMVTTTGTGDGSLTAAIDKANRRSGKDGQFPQQEIVIDLPDGNKVIAQNTTSLVVTARNLTIRAIGGATIDRNHLSFDCREADNIILRDLDFRGTGQGEPRDTITIDATRGRGPMGFWIDHCFFSAYFDLNITLNAKDLDGNPPPLLMTISSCHFYDQNPSGLANRNHGAMGLHGFTGEDEDGKDNKADRPGANRHTNAYVTVYRNCLDHIRRRSPRSSGRTVVHAFNNVLLKWGSDNTNDDQQSGMGVGHFGRLVAEANYFEHNVLTTPIEIANRLDPRLTIPASGPKRNLYDTGTTVPVTVGDPIIISDEYNAALKDAGVPKTEVMQPCVQEMTTALRTEIVSQAGVTAANRATGSGSTTTNTRPG